MTKLLIVPMLCIAFAYTYHENVSTSSAVILAGAVIKAHDAPTNDKYKRKDCPVCKGTGKYLSGDGIKTVDCGYCIP